MARTNYDYFRKANGWSKTDPLKLDTSGKYSTAQIIVMFETVGENPFEFFPPYTTTTYLVVTSSATVPATGEAVKTYAKLPAYTLAWNGADAEPVNHDYSLMSTATYGLELNWPEISLHTEIAYIDPQNPPADLQVSIWVIYK